MIHYERYHYSARNGYIVLVDLVFHVKKNMLVGVFLDVYNAFLFSSLPLLELWPLVIWLRAPLVLKEW